MAKKKNNKKNNVTDQPAAPNVAAQNKLAQQFTKSWRERNPILRFVLLFALLMGLFYAFWLTTFFKEYIFTPVAELNAWMASGILNIFGMGTTVSGDLVNSSQFSIAIKRGCDAIEPIALYASAILAFPLAFSKKWKGLLYGALFLLVLNLVRVVSLFLTGVYFPTIFDSMHEEVWQVIFIIMAIVCWMIWIQYETKKMKLDVQQ